MLQVRRVRQMFEHLGLFPAIFQQTSLLGCSLSVSAGWSAALQVHQRLEHLQASPPVWNHCRKGPYSVPEDFRNSPEIRTEIVRSLLAHDRYANGYYY